MLNAVSEIVDLTSRAFLQDDLTLARQVEPLEQVIDKLKDKLRTNHIARLQRGECSLAAGFVLSDLLTNLERVADHCSNIAGCLLDMKNERIDLHKYLGDVKSGSNEFLMQYHTFEENTSWRNRAGRTDNISTHQRPLSCHSMTGALRVFTAECRSSRRCFR